MRLIAPWSALAVLLITPSRQSQVEASSLIGNWANVFTSWYQGVVGGTTIIPPKKNSKKNHKKATKSVTTQIPEDESEEKSDSDTELSIPVQSVPTATTLEVSTEDIVEDVEGFIPVVRKQPKPKTPVAVVTRSSPIKGPYPKTPVAVVTRSFPKRLVQNQVIPQKAKVGTLQKPSQLSSPSSTAVVMSALPSLSEPVKKEIIRIKFGNFSDDDHVQESYDSSTPLGHDIDGSVEVVPFADNADSSSTNQIGQQSEVSSTSQIVQQSEVSSTSQIVQQSEGPSTSQIVQQSDISSTNQIVQQSEGPSTSQIVKRKGTTTRQFVRQSKGPSTSQFVQQIEEPVLNSDAWDQTETTLASVASSQVYLWDNTRLNYKIVSPQMVSYVGTLPVLLPITGDLTPLLGNSDLPRKVYRAAADGSNPMFELKVSSSGLLTHEAHILLTIEPLEIAPRFIYLGGMAVPVQPQAVAAGGVVPGQLYVNPPIHSVTEAVGITLAEHAIQTSASELVGRIAQVVKSLRALHSVGFVHGSISEFTLRMDLDFSRVLLTDFEFARFYPKFSTPQFKLTDRPTYWSPAELDGQNYLPRDDLYRTIETLFRLLIGGPPFVSMLQQQGSDAAVFALKSRALLFRDLQIPQSAIRKLNSALQIARNDRPNYKGILENLNAAFGVLKLKNL